MAQNSAYSTCVSLSVCIISWLFPSPPPFFVFFSLERAQFAMAFLCVGSLIITKKAKATGAKTHVICSGSRRIAGYFGYFEYNV